MLKKTFTGIIFFLTLISLFPAHLDAQVTYAVTPSKLEVFAKKGDTVSKSIEVYNKENQPIKIKVYVMDYRINPDNTFIFSPPGSESYSAASWIELKDTEFTVPASNPAKIPFTLKIPPNAEVGGHYAVIFFESAQKVKKEGVVRGRIGSVILVTVEGKVNRRGEIAQFEVIPSFLGQDIKTKVVFANEGNVHLTTRGEIVFLNSQGKKVGQENLDELTILPKTQRIMKVNWKEVPLFGKFKAIANIYYGSDLNTFNVRKKAQKSFYIIPWLYIMGFAIILGSAILIYLVVRNLRGARSSSSFD